MNRPKSMQPRAQNLNKGGLSSSASPNKNFKTRVVYKNVKLDDTLHDGRSLYSQSYNKTPQTHHGQRNQGKPAESARVSLADIGAMQRMNSSKVGVNNLKASSTVETPKTKTHFASVGGKGDMFASNNASSATLNSGQYQNHGQAQNQDKYKCGHALSPTKSGHELNQSMYDSQALKDAMLKEFGGNPSINVNNEAEYYETVKRLDVCGRCWAAQQKYYANPFKVAYKGPGQSLYQRDFVKHPLGDQGPVIKNDFYTTGFNNEPMDSGTTMKNDYRAWPTSPVKRENGDNRAATTGIPFGGQSNYRSEFVNWGPNNALHQKMPQATTVIPELPFQGKTSYRDNFGMPSATNQLKPMNPKNTKSPITAPIPFLGESTNASTYKPFKVQQAPNFDAPEEYEPTQALPEHMRSLYAKDFGPKPIWKCPAVIFMETATHPRLKHLNA